MKKHWKSMLAVGLSAVMLTGLMTPALAVYDTKGPVKTPLSVSNENGRKIQFLDIYDGETKSRKDLSDEVAFYTDAIKNNDFFKDWVSIAYNVFESQEKSYWDHAGNGWDEDFGKGNYIDFINDMQNASSTTGDGAMKATGLSVASSLKDVQTRAANDIAGLIDHQLGGGDFLDRHHIDGLSDANQTVLYSTVSTIDRYGKTYQYGYSSFTIAFYDFQLHVLSDEDVLEGEGTVTNTTTTPEDGFMTLAKNQSRNDITQTNVLQCSATETISTTMTNSETYNFGQSIGVSVSATAKFPGAGGITSGFSADISYGEAMSTSYSNSESVSRGTSSSSSSTVIVPAHTRMLGKTTIDETTAKSVFDCPVGLTYKVAIFSMCGTCYDDNALTQSFTTLGYEQRSFATFFGAASKEPDAVESLYQRATNHKDDPSYDATYGLTKGTNADGDSWCDGLSWKDIIAQGEPTSKKITSGLKGGTDLIYSLDDTYPMSISGGTSTVTYQSMNVIEMDPEPLYPIDTIKINWQINREFEMTVGEEKTINSYRVRAYDAERAPYYGFIPTWGTWKIVDKQGKETTSDVAKMEYDSVTKAQTLVALEPGTTYVKYFIPEDTYYTCDGVVSANKDIQSAAYKVVVSEESLSVANAIDLTGSVTTTVNEPMHLDLDAENLTVAAYDAEGKTIDAALTWEARESEGIVLTPDGGLTATVPGTYHIRAVSGNATSDWAEVTAEEPESLILYTCDHPFADVPHGTWYEPAVEYVYQNGIMKGVKDIVFSPDGKMTRAMMAQVLYNLEKAPFLLDENPFSDVSEDAWYSDAVVWAAKNGLTTGVSGERFAPNDPVTREQLLAFICRYADWKGIELDAGTADLSKYQDADQISSWAKDYVVRGLEAGIVQGKSATKLDPKGTASRAELAQVFMNLLDESV